MWNDNSSDFAESIKRMLKLGYKLEVRAIQKEFQQSQILGSNEKVN
jgi:hypothetical protein